MKSSNMGSPGLGRAEGKTLLVEGKGRGEKEDGTEDRVPC